MHLFTESIIGMGLLGIFFGMLLESAYIPIPSEIILPYAGYLVFLGKATFLTAGLTGLAGSLVGAFISYEIALYGGRPLVERYGRYIFIRRHELDAADRWFERHGDAAVFIGRLLPGIRTFISLPAGVARMRLGRFLVFSLLGAIPWTVLFMVIGYELGRNWKHVSGQNHVAEAIAVLILAVWVAWIVVRRRKSRATPRQ
jgi:membrane protein DedA with SNARE-associated domain